MAEGGQSRVDTVTLREQLSVLLNDNGRQALDEVIRGRPTIRLSETEAIGIVLRFDLGELAVIIEQLPAGFRPVQTLGRRPRELSVSPVATITPSNFSAYLNLVTNVDYASDTDFEIPSLFLNGAARMGNFAIEYEAAFSSQLGGEYQFFRRAVRAVYDEPERQRRWSAGDLEVPGISILRTPLIGGVALEKRRQIFNPFLPVSQLGSRGIFLDNPATVEVLLNGERYETFQLDAGQYDLSGLPLRLGTNDIQLVIRDSTGRTETIGLDYFFEPLDLREGEVEYSIAAGVVARNLTFEPDYTDEFAITGFYRKALSDNFLLGGAVELSEETQTLASQIVVVPQFVPGVLEVETGISHGTFGFGFATSANYRLRSGSSFANSQQLTVTFDYESARFQALADAIPANFSIMNLGVNYSRSLNDQTVISAGAVHLRRGGPFPDRSLVYADAIYRLNDRMRLTAGVEYGSSSFIDNDFGVRIGISMSIGGGTRASGDFRSRTSSYRANLSNGADSTVGSFGYDLGVFGSDGQASVDAGATYVGNRFDARVNLTSDGSNFGGIGDRQRARLQIGTSIAIADGAVGVGRPINDAFAVVYPHPSFGKSEVITGRSLSSNEYHARSGVLGGAVQSDLTSYVEQDLQYDLASGRPGIDIGDGTVRVDPPFRGGYNVQIGNDYFVSALGFLFVGEEPVRLATGVVRDPNDENFVPVNFFTNSAGRFSVIGLAPGNRYEVVLNDINRSFTIEVPADNLGLLRLGTLTLPPLEDEE